MDWVLHESIRLRSTSFSPPPPLPSPPPISPSILLIMVILAIIFFISGLLHLVVRYLTRPTNRDPDDTSRDPTALQGQLQQLFHLHDSGVEQSFIDSLPLFLYKSIIGLKDPFDCAVCLCEFDADDKLRLLPDCSHAFHLDCIDTWLLSHSTCPLCRGTLIPEFSQTNVLLDSVSDRSREIEPISNLGFVGEDDLRPSIHEIHEKSGVVPVKLGKFRNVDDFGGGGEGISTGNSNLDQRRCFSMGSYEYVMNESSLLQVAIGSKKLTDKKPRHRFATSECDCQSRREGFEGFEQSSNNGGASIGTSIRKRESFSVSKIWLRSKKEEPITQDSSRGAFSIRFPIHLEEMEENDGSKLNSITGCPRLDSEIDIAGSERSGSEKDLDVEIGSCKDSIRSLAEEAPSFGRKKLLWIVGRKNEVGNHV